LGPPSRPALAARTRNPPRHATRHSWPVDPSARRFEPERLFRREPRFAFERGERGLSWRDLILPEHALRGAPPRALGGER
jgi:hypothetical protein